MAKITRKNMKIFGSQAGLNQRGIIGSLAASNPQYSTDPETIQSLSNYLVGLNDIVMGGNSPAIEDLNSLFFLYAYQLSYLMQQGIAEWNADTTYYIGSLVYGVTGSPEGDGIYISLEDDNLNNDVIFLDKWRLISVPLNENPGQVLTANSNNKPSWDWVGVPTGAIMSFSSDTIPDGWLLCNGASNVSKETYSNLWDVIGTTFGSGDDANTFKIPDAREAALVGVGTRGSGVADHDVYNLGEFKDDQMQTHTHSYTYIPSGPYGGGSGFNNSNLVGNTTSTQSGRTGTVTRGKRLGVNYIIKY